MNLRLNLKSMMLGVAMVATSGSLWAQAPTIEASIAPDSVGIGDRFTYSITVDQDMVQVVGFPEFEMDPNSGIELVESPAPDTLEVNGRRLKLRKRYVLTSFEEGRYNMGVAKVLYLDKNITDTLYTKDSLMLDIATFQIDSTSQSIFDVKAQRDLPFKFAEISGYVKWGLLILLALAAIIAIAAYILSKQGRKLTDIFKPIPPLPPHIEAIKALESLQNQKLWQSEKYKEYYSGLTNILRHYIARRYSVTAMEMTSEEIIAQMKSIEDLPDKCRMDLNSLLREADFVKFAKAQPEASENEENYYRVYSFVEETKLADEDEQTNKKDK